MERMPSVEQPVTPEKTREELYFDTLKAKRDVLSSHYTLNQLRRGKKIETMSEAEIEDYKSVKNEYDKRRELFLTSFDNLNEADGQKVSELTSLTKVEIELSKLEKPVEADIEVKPTEGVKPEDFDIVGETRIHRGESIVAKPRVERPPRDMTLEEIDQKIAFAQRQNLGLSGESAGYWEAQKAQLLERQEAETNPDRSAPRGFLQRVRDGFIRGLNKIEKSLPGDDFLVKIGYAEYRNKEGKVVDREGKLIEPTQSAEAPNPAIENKPDSHGPFSAPGPGLEILQRKTSQPEVVQPEPVQPESTTQQAEKEPKKPSAWGWLKERGEGILTFGLWELRQAERFRSKTKEVANDTKALATLIQQERNLNLEEAEKEAWETVEELKKSNLDISASEFYQANKDITERKKKENDQEIEYIIKSAGNDLIEKLAKYRGEAGQDVLTRENQLAFEADLRGELNKMRDGASRKDFVNFAKLMRRNLDENWHWRYVWGGIEVLAWVGVGWASMKFLASKGATEVVATGAGKGGAGAAEKFVTEGMHKSVWHSLEQIAQSSPGHFTPTPEQLTEWSKSVLETNHWYEPEWVKGVVEGLRSSRMLPEGITMKIPVAIMKAMGY